MLLSSALLLIPAAYLLGALLPWPGHPGRARWPLSLGAASAGVVLAAAAGIALLTGDVAPAPIGGGLATRLDGLTVTMLLLVTVIAGLILRFSRRYLDGEAGLERYQRSFLATMAATTLLVVTNHLLVLGLAWIATSIALHQLLTFYGDRPEALVAAHKKFLLSRLADLAIMGGVVLIGQTSGTYAIDEIVALAATRTAFPLAMELGGVLLAVGVLLRSAQLPFHGWLIQVMEAPTPVSALLHAGVVNIGGFVLIRLGGLVGRLDAAQSVLVVVGTLTAVLASLVMTTRVSVKVSLAWSTCAQMGFMLLECGLGAYGLALLHLVAHSLYKAHAFLSSGRAVEQQLQRTLAPAARAASLGGWAVAALASAAVVGAVARIVGIDLAAEPATAAITVVAALALAPLLLRVPHQPPSQAWRLVGAAIGLATLYGLGHALVGPLVPTVPPEIAHAWVRAGVVIAAFVALYGIQAAILSRPTGRLARALYPACFAGFYFDEIFTRLTFRLWPPRTPVARSSAAPSTTHPVFERAA